MDRRSLVLAMPVAVAVLLVVGTVTPASAHPAPEPGATFMVQTTHPARRAEPVVMSEPTTSPAAQHMCFMGRWGWDTADAGSQPLCGTSLHQN
jgi:hypothetical protein